MFPMMMFLGSFNPARATRTDFSTAIDWSPDLRWQPTLVLTGASFEKAVEKFRFFDVAPGERVYDASKAWFFKYMTLPRGRSLRTMSGRRKGHVYFDTDVQIPTLFASSCPDEPWMSITPMELLTLRPGTKRAKGRVVVAGLGLGHQLIEAANRRSVTSVVVIERDASLVTWLMPHIERHLPAGKVQVVIGDAWKELPKLEADVALVDVFPNYGGNSIPYEVQKTATGIRSWWVWGAA